MLLGSCRGISSSNLRFDWLIDLLFVIYHLHIQCTMASSQTIGGIMRSSDQRIESGGHDGLRRPWQWLPGRYRGPGYSASDSLY